MAVLRRTADKSMNIRTGVSMGSSGGGALPGSAGGPVVGSTSNVDTGGGAPGSMLLTALSFTLAAPSLNLARLARASPQSSLTTSH